LDGRTSFQLGDSIIELKERKILRASCGVRKAKKNRKRSKKYGRVNKRRTSMIAYEYGRVK
jgi:hypothetical protein